MCENPLADKSDGRVFILHTRTPKILAEIFHYENYDENEFIKIQEFASSFDIGAQLDYPPELIIFGVIWIEKFEVAGQKTADNIAGIMRRMSDWYKTYLIWEDEREI